MIDDKAVRVRVTGRVQGVWFRAWTQQNAEALGLFGWVRNREDGSVEALFKGVSDKVEDMLKRCESGPDMASVDHVEVTDAMGIVPNRFEVKPTV
ncbi:MAG: acylphosphatase [Sphingomonadales bacterium]|nr:acylphosphatase [Sphingomonadales bacterium]